MHSLIPTINELPEIFEITGHPWFISVQFHPEFLSRAGKPHPLLNDFVRAASKTIVEGTQYPLNGATKS